MDGRVNLIQLDESPPSKSLQVAAGTQKGYHDSYRCDVVVQPAHTVTILNGITIHRGAVGPGTVVFIVYLPRGFRTSLLTVEPENTTELMWSVPMMEGNSEQAMRHAPEEGRTRRRSHRYMSAMLPSWMSHH